MFIVRHLGRKGTILLGAILLALAITGGTFASGFVNQSMRLSSVTAASGDFASVSPSGSNLPSWRVWGLLKGTIGGPGTTAPFNLFDVTSVDNYTGDMVLTVSIANGNELVKVYRVLNLFLDVVSKTSGNPVDINSDNTTTDGEDYALLTLNNGSVDFFISQWAGSDNYTIRLKSGFYVANVHGANGLAWPENYQQPVMYAQIAQK